MNEFNAPRKLNTGSHKNLAEQKKKLSTLVGSFALGNFLSEWDDEKDYDDITEILTNAGDDPCSIDSDVLTVWEPFEMTFPSDVAGHIDDMHNSVKSLLENVLTLVVKGELTPEEALKLVKGL